MSILDDFKRTTVTVNTYLGADGNGDLYGPDVASRPFVEEKRRQVRSATGELVVSETTLFDELATATVYVAGSKVTVNGRSTNVIVCAPMDMGDPDVDHVQVALQ